MLFAGLKELITGQLRVTTKHWSRANLQHTRGLTRRETMKRSANAVQSSSKIVDLTNPDMPARHIPEGISNR